MLYNLHPIFVHFPIALLVIYSVIKLLPLQKWFPRIAWKHIERALLFFGVLGAFASLATGETAEQFTQANHKLVETHSTFAAVSTWMYGALLVGEFADYLSYKYPNAIILFFKKFLADGWFPKLLAFLALISISLTGLLGGVMVYGISADPFAPIILKLFKITLLN